MLSIFADWIVKIYKSIYFPQDLFASLEQVNDVCKQVTVSNVFTIISSVIMTLGLSIMLIYFFMDLAEKSATSMLSIQQLFLAFLKLILVAILMSYSQRLISGILDFGSALADTLLGIDTSVEQCWFDLGSAYDVDGEEGSIVVDNMLALESCLDSLPLLNQVVYVIKLIPPYLIALVTDIIFYTILISRSVELSVRSLFCPIALADAFNDTRRSTAIRYLKKLVALSLQLTVAVVIVLSINLMIKEISYTLTDPSEVFQTKPEFKGKVGVFVGLVKSQVGGAVGGVQDGWEFADGSGTISHLVAAIGGFIWGSIKGFFHGLNPITVTAVNPDAVGSFLASLLGGTNYWAYISLGIAKAYMLIKSQSLSSDIVGTS